MNCVSRSIKLFFSFLLLILILFNPVISQQGSILKSSLKITDKELLDIVIKNAQGNFILSTQKYRVIVCYKNKPDKYLFYSNGCYYSIEELTPYEIYLKSQINPISFDKKLLIKVISGIEATNGSFYYKIINETNRNIDLDVENETLTVRIPYLNSSLAKYSRNSTIVVIDTGIDLNHPWFTNKNIEAYGVILNTTTNTCELNNIYDGDSFYSGHGTFVTSEVVSLTSNKTKIIFLYPNSLLSSNLACAIKLAVERFEADVITMSLGTIPWFFDGYNDIVYDAVSYALNYTKNKTLIFAAAGNEGGKDYHIRLIQGIINLKNLQTFSLYDNPSILLKNYVKGKYNITFFDGNPTLEESTPIAIIYWNTTSNTYNFQVDNTNLINFDPDNDTIPNIYLIESGRTRETNLIIEFSTSLDNLSLEIKPLSNFTTDFYFMSFLIYTDVKFVENGDSYGTIVSPAIHPGVFAIGSLTTQNFVYYFNNLTKDYFALDHTSSVGNIGNLSSFSSRGLEDVDNFTLKKITLIAPGTLFGANYKNYYYAIYQKTNTLGATPEFTLFFDGNSFISYLTFKYGTSMATPFAASIFTLMKSILKHGDINLFKSLLPYITFDTSLTSNLKFTEKGHGIIDINKAFNILPNAILENYQIDYSNNTLKLYVKVYNNLNVSYNLPYLEVEIKDNAGTKIFNFTNLTMGINELVINTSLLNISYNGTSYNLTLKGDILTYSSYIITFNGTKVILQNTTVYLDLLYENGSLILNNSILELTLNYTYNYLGNISCEIYINDNLKNTTVINKFGINKINVSYEEFSLSSSNLKVYCDKNSEIINYNVYIFDFIKEKEKIIFNEILNITFYNNATLINALNSSLAKNLYYKIRVKIDNDSFNYYLSPKQNISLALNLTNNENFDYKAKNFFFGLLKENSFLDSLLVKVYSKINLTEFEIFSLNKKDNNYFLDFKINLSKESKIINNCSLIFYRNTSLIENKTILENFFLNNENLSKKDFIGIIDIYTFTNFYNISLDKKINVTIEFSCQNNYISNKKISKIVYFNSSLINNYNFTINILRNSFFDNLSVNLTSNTTFELYKIILSKFNNSFIYLEKKLNSTSDTIEMDWKEINSKLLELLNHLDINYSQYYFYIYNLSSSLTENYLTNNLNLYSFNIISKIYFPFNNNATYFSLEKSLNIIQTPNLTLFSNLSGETLFINLFGNSSSFLLYLKNKENKNLSFIYRINLKELKIQNESVIKISFNETYLLFNYSKIKEILNEEGSFNLTIEILYNLTYLNKSFLLPLINFKDFFLYDLIYPRVINFHVVNANCFENICYTNNNSIVNITLTERNFDNYFSVDLAINNNTAVIYNIKNLNITHHLIEFFINKTALNYGHNNIYIYLKDTFGNKINKSFILVFDNVSPSIFIEPNSATAYNLISIFVGNLDDFPWKINAKNLQNNVSQEFEVIYKTPILFNLPCVSLSNNISITLIDKANNTNNFNYIYQCYLDFNIFNISSEVPIYNLIIKNRSQYFITLQKLNTSQFIKDNFLYINNSYKLNVNGDIEFLLLGIEEKKEENDEIYNLVTKDFSLINENYKENFILYKNSTLVVSMFVFRNLIDESTIFYSIHRRKIFDFYLKNNLSLIYYKNIPVIINITGNVSEIEIKNLNTSYYEIIPINNNLTQITSLIPCINGKNLLSITARKDTAILSKNYSFYCNNSLVIGDNYLNYAIFKNQSFLIINDSIYSDLLNETTFIKNILINFTNNEIFLELIIPWDSSYSIKNISLKKDNTSILIEDYELINDQLFVRINLTQDPVLVIIGEKVTTLTSTSTENGNNQEESTSTTTSSTSSSSSSYSSSSSEPTYSPTKEASFEEKIILNESLIFILKKVNQTVTKLNISIPFIEELKIYSQINKTIKINISINKENNTMMNRKVLYRIKVNEIKNASLLIKLKEEFVYLIKDEIWKNLNKKTISLKENDEILVLSKELIYEPQRDQNVDQIKKENVEKPKEKIVEEKEEEIEQKEKEIKKENKTNIKKVLIYLGIAIIIFLIIDFIDFLIKRKKGLV